MDCSWHEDDTCSRETCKIHADGQFIHNLDCLSARNQCSSFWKGLVGGSNVSGLPAASYTSNITRIQPPGGSVQ